MFRRRSLFVFVTVVCLLALGASGCSSAPEKKDESLTGAEARVPAFFEEIPATTPYVMASIEPFPMEVFEPYMAAYAEMYAELDPQMQALSGQQSYRQDMEPAEKFMFALFEELSAVKTIEGYEQLGFSRRPQAAIYGIGWFPVMRMTLGNAQAFEGVLSRLETKAGLDVQMSSLGGQTYRQYDLGGEAKVALAVTDGEAILGVAPTEAFDEFLSYMLGQKKPARSMADVGVLQDIRAKYDYLPFAVGYADVVGLFASATGAAPGDQITKAMLAAIDYVPPSMTEVCRQEYLSIVEKVPRVVLGYTALSADVQEMSMVFETQGDIAKELAGTKAPMPGYGTEMVEKAFFAAGIGVDVQKMIAFTNAQADRIHQAPFQCADLQEINEAAQNLRMVSQLVPPFVSNLRGATAAMSEFAFDMQQSEPTSFEALAMIESADPAGLLSQLQMYVPQLQGIAAKSDGVPVALQPLADAPWLQVPHLAMDQDTLAASAGVGMQDEMAVLLEDPSTSASANAPMMLLAYDYGRLMEMVGQGASGWGAGAGQPSGFGNSFNVLQEMLGTFVMEVDANDKGVVMRYRLNMSPPRSN